MEENQIIYLEQERLDEIQHELDQLQTSGREEIQERIRLARELGDLSENADYDTAKEDQGMLENRIRQLRDIVARARILDQSAVHSSVVVIGSPVVVRSDAAAEERRLTIVSIEPDPEAGTISSGSPLGRALMGRRVGDRVEVTPRGKKTAVWTVISVGR